MALTVEQKAQIIKDFQRKEGDTGSSEVQIALLTYLRNTDVDTYRDVITRLNLRK